VSAVSSERRLQVVCCLLSFVMSSFAFFGIGRNKNEYTRGDNPFPLGVAVHRHSQGRQVGNSDYLLLLFD
jgi:hypothetical protein